MWPGGTGELGGRVNWVFCGLIGPGPPALGPKWACPVCRGSSEGADILD